MKKILLVCNAGMSTSMLVAKMKKAAQADGVEVSIEAKSLADAKKEIQEAILSFRTADPLRTGKCKELYGNPTDPECKSVPV